jgi:periodic tryptophan protein 2
LIYSLDETTTFDPFDLTLDLTPESVLQTIKQGEYLVALIMALRLSEKPLIQRAYEAVPPNSIKLVARQIPGVYIDALLSFMADHMESSPHLEFDLIWVGAMLTSHGRYLRDRKGEMGSVFRGMTKGLMGFEAGVSKLCDENTFALDYILSKAA